MEKVTHPPKNDLYGNPLEVKNRTVSYEIPNIQQIRVLKLRQSVNQQGSG